MIVRLPPKQIMLDAFVEERRRNLQRWLILISQHPILSRDEMLKVFLTESSELHQEMTHSIEIESECDLSRKYEFKVVLEKQQAARKILNQIIKIKRLLEQQLKRQIETAEDFEWLSQALSNVGQELCDNLLKDYSEGFHTISSNFNKSSSHDNQQAAVIERIELIVEIFTAFCDLTERCVDESEKTPTTSATNHWQRLQSAIKAINTTEVNDDDARERRINFSVHCVLEEFNFALKYLKLLPSVLMKFSYEQSDVYTKFGKMLNDIVDAESDKLNS
jgi:PX domain